MSEDTTAGGEPQDTGAQSELPDTAMMSGSDEGEPGERLAPLPLDDSDKAVLAALREPGHATGDSVEDGPEVAAAAEDDSPLPVREPVRRDDPLDAQFREP